MVKPIYCVFEDGVKTYYNGSFYYSQEIDWFSIDMSLPRTLTAQEASLDKLRSDFEKNHFDVGKIDMKALQKHLKIYP